MQYHSGIAAIGYDSRDYGQYTCDVCKHTRTKGEECYHEAPYCVVDPATRGANTTPQMMAVLAGKRRMVKIGVLVLCIVLLVGIGCFLYNFAPAGFFGGGTAGAASPTPTVQINAAAAGTEVPVVLALGGDRGTNILAAGYPQDRVVSCADFVERPGDRVEPADSTSGLRYSAKTGHYTYAWKTDKSWASSCRELVFKFAGNVSGIANGEMVMDFRFG